MAMTQNMAAKLLAEITRDLLSMYDKDETYILIDYGHDQHEDEAMAEHKRYVARMRKRIDYLESCL